MPYSHHSHSGQFCQHAKGTLEEVVQEAIRQNFKVYGLTEHVPRYREEDLYPEEEGMPLKTLEDNFEGFLDEAHRLRLIYKEQISLLVGLETEYITIEDLDKLELLLKKHRDLGRIDYIVGSVHHVNEIPIDFDKATYKKAVASCMLDSDASDTDSPSLERFLCKYFDQQFDMISRFLPEVVGHIDLCRLYTPELKLEDFPNAWQKLKKNIEFAASYGALFELNAAAFRKGWDTAYPGRDVLIQEHGGKFTLSDDSHGPQGVGLNYDKLEKYVQDVGISDIFYLCQSEGSAFFDRNVRAVGESVDNLSVHNRATINAPTPHHGDT
ncbi:hypothetical protein PLEOSDRAFT_1065338 [Pleurotus ostreatus PC15]|uniref:Histidinol-phosphatase n=1 Tax=Pleurotus ostreatus (strain PC15) TaxID=1137138 RepID=A0A067NWL8_PLEO1|nr:hypothetical protein PLEOSDRAFT_1065338 [Pleurotus ostreatus PC15]